MDNNAKILRILAPGQGVAHIHGVSYDGCHVWAAAGDRLLALDPKQGEIRKIVSIPATAGTAFDGRHLYQISGGRIRVIDHETGKCVRDFAAPPGDDCSGMAWSEGSLWIGQYEGRRILEVSPENGRVLREIEVGRLVTGVTWAGDQLWHGSWDGERGALHQFDPEAGETRRTIRMPDGVPITGVEANGDGQAFCGAGAQGIIHVVQLDEK
ncbi:glutamine cyclotransferase [Altererythrobacter xixiisoli]|uniref:Glutamine cyclotransferase n=1 Tax=Croceibacterium xixiisoli TaxID=1476466 RepID=A0A6I4TXE5_9SPHN|nr:SMP-30/gluconolactonase/LRE family protein [Croceibacterium xixiisoli]MXP00583.1 glutamine cyclotransferase [Croceibacterium xixiisoli]